MPDDRTNKVSCSSYTYELEVAFEILSGKWVPQIIWHLSGGKQRFGQLRRLMPGISQKMLTQQLRGLERNGIVNRNVFSDTPPVVEYSLTPIGTKLVDLFEGIDAWAMEYLENRDEED